MITSVANEKVKHVRSLHRRQVRYRERHFIIEGIRLVEEAFRAVDGVVSTVVGYSGGTVKDPAYEDVCTGETGHAEVVQIEFDPSRVSYWELLQVFWNIHDPTTLNQQGPDTGTQYRSAVFYHTPRQKALAMESRAALESSGRSGIVTEITPASTFYRAEEYHQRYLEKRGLSRCKP
jgi:peptide-methionine (S)-S-oxide reductase